MAFSGSVANTTFNALKVIDHAFRRCRLPAQAITGEMQSYALDSLSFMLSELANIRTPSWCIEKLILPMYENQYVIPLPLGTVEILNLNYRQIQPVTGVNTVTATEYRVDFTDPTVVDTVGIKWSTISTPVEFQVSNDGLIWTTVGSSSASATSGQITWTDISGALAYPYFKIVATGTFLYQSIVLGNLPQEIPLGALNRDGYVAQSNKVFPGRPTSYWYQRDIPEPIINLWPAPFAQAEAAQLIVWRHRQIMDTQNLRQEVEIPARWLEAIINGLSARLAAETPQVAADLMPLLEQRAAISMQRAWDGDHDGSPTYIQPTIGVYTK